MTKRAHAVLVLLGLLTRFPSACEDIAILYGDAKYLLLDGDTLAVVDVGNLGTLGVWRVQEVVPGSTSRLFAVSADHLSSEFYLGTENGYYPSKLVVVEDLEERDDTASRIEVGHYAIGYADARWIGRTDRLAVWRDKASRFSVLDKHLKEIEGWRVSGYDADATLACRSGDRVIVGGLRTRFEAGDGVVEALAFPEGTAKCRMSGTLLGCLGGFGCQRDGRFVNGVLDMATNEVAFAFEYDGPITVPKDPAHIRPSARFKDRLLFADGTRLLQQESVYTPIPEVVGFEVDPSSRLRILDTGTGRVVRENASAPVGTVSRLFCRSMAERFVLAGDGKAHLMDLGTLEPVATASIPMGRPFVF